MILTRSFSHACRALASSATASAFPSIARPMSSTSTAKQPKKHLVTHEEGVHQTMTLSKSWRNKPLFRRQGDVRFKSGLEASKLLIAEANRRDAHEIAFIESISSTMECLSPLFDRNPRYAFVAKQLMEPERFIQFRVAWMDDLGVIRLNRGFRIQYSSSLGPYEGPLHLGAHVNAGLIKALGFDNVFSNGLTGYDVGSSVGGSDFNPFDKSETEVQRFCQSYMTELSKYVGPDLDLPTMGMGVAEREMGYMFGQYKRINMKSTTSGVPFMTKKDSHVPGHAVVLFAKEMLKDRNQSLMGKKCLILGSGKNARSVAEKLLEYGAIPLTFSDESGYVLEPNGIDASKLKTISKIKTERGAMLGRYVTSSTTAQFNEPANIFDIPCDLCFPCGPIKTITSDVVAKLADNGCMGVIEGGHKQVTIDGRQALKNRGVMYGPHIVTLTGANICHAHGHNLSDKTLEAEVHRIYNDVKDAATEFNARGDLFAGGSMVGFLRVANAMMAHGAV
ncbi:hypothetical protein HJC23_001095 [Cyclotella cryptica]|uniref:Glutamate/phenylalanine/leucine/valine/L-tryptophan dehydrogenase C-terminal domain-containing protein n=1 Tax=Cyclotella cryptica TaxID=29204 RepID=A0ABD3QJT5_9STRA